MAISLSSITMATSYQQQMIIAITQSLIAKYGALLDIEDLGHIFKAHPNTIKNKFCEGARDVPRYTQLQGKRVVMAQDLAEFMVTFPNKF
ncbi:hypothetical protein [Helicobacter salomonis]|uniref:hypothetical protein n=1 Tax=Helicobacter salomonis TaxID=56878 RepID=UPI0013158B17|nr:hypothetical protein [Helicobacter salomonis]